MLTTLALLIASGLGHHNVSYLEDPVFGDPFDLSKSHLEYNQRFLTYRKSMNGRTVEGVIDTDGEFIITHYPTTSVYTTSASQGLPGVRDGVKVYEFRSGMLIPGHIKKGKFVPLLGGTVEDFKKYHPFLNPIPIYNLPGKFEWGIKKSK